LPVWIWILNPDPDPLTHPKHWFISRKRCVKKLFKSHNYNSSENRDYKNFINKNIHLDPDLELTGVIPVAVNEGEAAIVVVLNRIELRLNLLLPT
jgi:hypothetical protein